MAGSSTQFGIVNEAVWGTAVLVTKFYEIISESFVGQYPRIQAEALSAAFVQRADRMAVMASSGAAGSVELEPLTKGFGNWLQYMLGNKVTGAPTETICYPHTGTIASLAGKSLTVQVGRARYDDTVVPWTYEGGKVTGFEFSNAVDQTLRAKIDMDFEKESQPASPTGAYVLATNVPVTGAEVLTWAGGTIKIGGTAMDVSDISVKVDNALRVDTRYINKAAAGKREQVQDGQRKIEWEFKAPYTDSALWNKVAAATLAGATATLEAKWEGPTLLGTTIYPSLTISVPIAVFNEGGPSVSGPGVIDQSMKGVGLYDGTNSAISIVYVSSDTTII